MQITKRSIKAMVSAFVTAAVAIQTTLPVFAGTPVSANRELPSYYNLVEHGYVSPVRNQGNTGTCWAHSALGAAESSLIMDGLADIDIDLSETHLVWFAQGQNTDPNDPLYGDPLEMGSDCYYRGGSPFWSIGAFAAWIGPTYECNYPSVTELASIDEANRYDAVYHLQKAVFFDNDDTDAMKKFIMEDGALTVYYRNKKELYKNTSEYTSSYSTNPQHSHAVTIVGWDDNFSKENFVEPNPPGDGAWIIKNSKGTKFGKEGYFYLSYYDASIDLITGMKFESANNYGKIYQHNITAAPLFGCGDNSITGANVFTASGNDPLAAVSFCAAEDVPYIISIYKGVSSTNPMSGTLMHTQTGVTDYEGYHTVKLTQEVNIPSGEKFSVCVALDKPHARIWGDSNAKEKGTSFYTSGIGTPSSKWKDESDINTRNLAIKAFTKYTGPVKPTNVKATTGVNSVTLKWDKVPGATKYKVCYKNGSKYTVLTSDCKTTTYEATGLKAGKKYEFVVRAYVNGKWSAFNTSDLVSATPKASAKPTNVRATAGVNSVTLKWDKVPGATKYKVCYKNGNKYTVLTSDCKKTTFKATGLKDGKNYDFVVRAYVDGKWSEFRASDLVSAKPKASTKPTNVKATAGVNSVTLKWDKVSGATKYKVCYKNGSKYTVLTSDCKTTTYEATGLKAGKKYEFVVRAYVNGKWSDFNASDLVSATPKASTNA